MLLQPGSCHPPLAARGREKKVATAKLEKQRPGFHHQLRSRWRKTEKRGASQMQRCPHSAAVEKLINLRNAPSAMGVARLFVGSVCFCSRVFTVQFLVFGGRRPSAGVFGPQDAVCDYNPPGRPYTVAVFACLASRRTCATLAISSERGETKKKKLGGAPVQPDLRFSRMKK